jgi:hypothetical protein
MSCQTPIVSFQREKSLVHMPPRHDVDDVVPQLQDVDDDQGDEMSNDSSESSSLSDRSSSDSSTSDSDDNDDDCRSSYFTINAFVRFVIDQMFGCVCTDYR